MQFLVEKVWCIDNPIHVLDCGCGFGFLGLMLLPLLPNGSTYTGVDFTEEMLDEGKKLFAAEGYCRQQNTIIRHLREHVDETALTQFTGIMISYGWK